MKHLSAEQVKKLLSRALETEEFYSVDDHLAECKECRQRVSDLQADFKDFRNDLMVNLAETTEHLEFEQLAAIADGTLVDHEKTRLEEHLNQCSLCLDELQDLKSFREGMTSDVQRFPVLQMQKKTVLPRFLKTLAYAAVLVIAVLAATIPFRNRINQLQTELNKLESENETLRRESNRGGQQQASDQPSLVLHDGSMQVLVSKNGDIHASLVLPPEEQKMLREALKDQNIQVTQEIKSLIKQTEVLMGDSDKLPFALISPVGTAVVDTRSHFQWETLAGAESYQVRIYDPDFKLVGQSPPISETEWTASQDLPAEIPLTWQVAAIKKGEEVIVPFAPFPDARFMILKPADIARVKEYREKYAGSHLILGLKYAQLGLLDDAEKEFTQLQLANPKSPEATKLLQNVRLLRHR